MSLQGGHSNWDYLRVLVGSAYITGMSEHQMLYILAGKPKMVTPDYSATELLRLWAGGGAHPGYSNWDWLRVLTQSKSLFKTGDTINDMLRKLAAAYPNGYP
jgi:tetrahydromethanopterin S-methyltransferase subunit H